MDGATGSSGVRVADLLHAEFEGEVGPVSLVSVYVAAAFEDECAGLKITREKCRCTYIIKGTHTISYPPSSVEKDELFLPKAKVIWEDELQVATSCLQWYRRGNHHIVFCELLHCLLTGRGPECDLLRVNRMWLERAGIDRERFDYTHFIVLSVRKYDREAVDYLRNNRISPILANQYKVRRVIFREFVIVSDCIANCVYVAVSRVIRWQLYSKPIGSALERCVTGVVSHETIFDSC